VEKRLLPASVLWAPAGSADTHPIEFLESETGPHAGCAAYATNPGISLVRAYNGHPDPDHWVNETAVMYTAPDGQQFLAPPNADWCKVYATGQQQPDEKDTLKNLGQNGPFDFQRSAQDYYPGGDYYPSYRLASNYAVGVYMNGAGHWLISTEAAGEWYAFKHSGNFGDPLQSQWWTNGWTAAEDKKLTGCSCHTGN
jgi:hypothetical protein